MERQELRMLLMKMKKQLELGVEWANINMSETTYCEEGEYHSLNEAYFGAIVKSEFDEVTKTYHHGKLSAKNILSYDYTTIEYNEKRKSLYACVSVVIQDDTGLIEKIEINICNMTVK